MKYLLRGTKRLIREGRQAKILLNECARTHLVISVPYSCIHFASQVSELVTRKAS